MLLRADEKPDIRYEYPTELEAPVHEGQEVGQASYYINDEQVLLTDLCGRNSGED